MNGVMLELGAQAARQFPTFSRKEVQLVVHISRSLSDQLLRVGRSAVILEFPAHHQLSFIQMFALARDWWNELLSSICRSVAPRARGIASLRSRPRFQKENPELARPWLSRFHHTSPIMLVGVTIHGHWAVWLEKLIAPS